jgi:hypothetical protein
MFSLQPPRHIPTLPMTSHTAVQQYTCSWGNSRHGAAADFAAARPDLSRPAPARPWMQTVNGTATWYTRRGGTWRARATQCGRHNEKAPRKARLRIRTEGSHPGFRVGDVCWSHDSRSVKIAAASDIEKSPSRDSLRISPPSVQDSRISPPETRLLAANLRKCRHFREHPKSLARDRGGWLGCQDSNCDVSLQGAPEVTFTLGVGADRTMIRSA